MTYAKALDLIRCAESALSRTLERGERVDLLLDNECACTEQTAMRLVHEIEHIETAYVDFPAIATEEHLSFTILDAGGNPLGRVELNR